MKWLLKNKYNIQITTGRIYCVILLELDIQFHVSERVMFALGNAVGSTGKVSPRLHFAPVYVRLNIDKMVVKTR